MEVQLRSYLLRLSEGIAVLAAILHENARARLTNAWMHLPIPEWSEGIWCDDLSKPGLDSTNRHVAHVRHDEHAEKAHGGAFSAQQEPEFWRQFHVMTQNSGEG
jgi:hypothetical protein